MIKKIQSPIFFKLLSISGYILIYLLLIISLMPIIAWWAGLIGLGIFILQVYLFVAPQRPNLQNLFAASAEYFRLRKGKIVFYIIFFGLIVHSACRIHSEILIHKLYLEASEEKKLLVGKLVDE